VRPVEPGARQKPHRAVVETGMHAVAVELDFVQPLVAWPRLFDELRELRPYPVRQTVRVSAEPSRYWPRHAGERRITVNND